MGFVLLWKLVLLWQLLGLISAQWMPSLLLLLLL
jgi:hypothetical protein